MEIHSKCEHNLQQSEAQTKQVNQPTKQETHIFFKLYEVFKLQNLLVNLLLS